MKSTIAALTVLGLASAVYGQSSLCQGDVCYKVAVPQSSSSSNSGDFYFQIAAPTAYQWVATGPGSGMAGALMFVMYQSADGTNVTVALRTANGEETPYTIDSAQLTILEGSGVNNSHMVANVRCSGCNTWNGGSLDLKSSSASWIYANKYGYAIRSDSPQASIQQHGNDAGTINWDFTAARVTNDANPFAVSGVSSDSGSSSGSNGSTGVPVSTVPTVVSSHTGMTRETVMLAHRIMATLAFLIFFPIGGILIRVANFKGLVRVHAAFQGIGFLFYLVAFGMGVWLALNVSDIKEAHPIIGIGIFLVLLVQPVLGWLHHKFYKQNPKRTAWSWMHIGIGRLAILVGMVNGGLGLQLAGDNQTGHVVGYSIVASVMGLLYISAIVYGELKRRRYPTQYERQDDDMQLSSWK